VRSLAELMLSPNAVRILKALVKYSEGLTFNELLDEAFSHYGTSSYARRVLSVGTFNYHLKKLAFLGFIAKQSRRYVITPVGELMLLSRWELEEVAENL